MIAVRDAWKAGQLHLQHWPRNLLAGLRGEALPRAAVG